MLPPFYFPHVGTLNLGQQAKFFLRDPHFGAVLSYHRAKGTPNLRLKCSRSCGASRFQTSFHCPQDGNGVG